MAGPDQMDRPRRNKSGVIKDVAKPAAATSLPPLSSRGVSPQPGTGTTPGAKEPAVFRPPNTSPSKRFAWRKQIQGQQDNGQNRDGSSPRAPPGCVKNVGYSGSAGENKKRPMSSSMMHAYVAMRAGANGVDAYNAEPLLAWMLDQEVVKELGVPKMAYRIQGGMSPYMSVYLTHPEVNYDDHLTGEKHLLVPPRYDVQAIYNINAMRSNGWNTANAKED